MEQLYLSHASARRTYRDREYRTPSRFISEIPEDLIKPVDRYRSPFRQADGLYEEIPDEAADYYVNQIVHHPQFGRGKVTKVGGAGRDVYITVRFSRTGMIKHIDTSIAPDLTVFDD